ncbi:pterin-4-alpha-carbinolamine dehydratase [Draconibacterium orientale]|jgi:4a-hydroxytetrahydrobiopterin dehydratase|uniref:Putative pterin-4-alpha-carbinolamine dehydratase n=1 Tax=Draconibacterium orientale TaxID=1168034 RepID=X5DGQ8_9BACT|nr:4a-hydroxytetrahydrobiopterin dehydratase [Draconibacterium orientale]AHW60244.1 pterin-4-alpha-carbinolamine dehydratase [Draconibacterium orientale]SET66159.1 pterin-4-alpha-carbinolamine dehydratase [Draconibacterium orientale]
MSELKEKHCTPCKKETTPLNAEEIKHFKKKINEDWKVVDDKKIRKSFSVKDFNAAIAFAQKIAVLADEEDHHPDLGVHYGSVEVEISTHNIGGLSPNDFILAAKIDAI